MYKKLIVALANANGFPGYIKINNKSNKPLLAEGRENEIPEFTFALNG